MSLNLPCSVTSPKHLVASSFHFPVRRQPIKNGAFLRLFIKAPFMVYELNNRVYLDCNLGLPVDLLSVEEKVNRAPRIRFPTGAKLLYEIFQLDGWGVRRLLHRFRIPKDQILILISFQGSQQKRI
jgi:hypothetical protein